MTRAWVNGVLLDEHEAAISVFDHGLTVGDGVFETLDIRRGVPFAIRRHLERLRHSAERMGLHVPATDQQLRAAMAAVMDGHDAGRIRVTVTSGPGPAGSGRSADGCPTAIVSLSEPAHTTATTSVTTVPWPRNERGALAGVKTTSYGENVVALAYARAHGGSEALFANTRGELCEGTGSNVFLVLDGTLMTPTLASGCLDGVTRQLLCELLDVAERDVPLAALFDADEVFLASTTRDVQPVEHVDARPVPHAPGPLTRHAAECFARLVARDLDP